jgi:integrase
MLRIKQTKTGAIVHVPIHTAVRTILKKYGNNIPKVISNQKFNTALKLICQKADLGKVIIEGRTVEKWQEITTHTARRSFATNAYLSRSMDVYQIMRFTGHKSESSFLRYLKLDGKDFAIQSADSKFFQDDIWTTLKVAS